MKHTLIYYSILEYRPENLKLLNDNFHVITLSDPSEDTPDLLKKADVIMAPLGYYFGREKIDLSSRLKVIGSNTTGHPHIDIAYAAEKGISVVTLKDQHDFLETITPTAELTWGLIISVTRNMFPAFMSVLDGKWSRWSFGAKSMLSRMSLGIAGYGRLGRKVASYGVCFGMDVSYFDPYVSEHPKSIRRAESLVSLVESSDIITLHVPHEPDTENLFSREIFEKFKDGSFFVNTARAELVDSSALLDSLESGRIAGAAVDVMEGEFERDFEKRVKESPLARYAAVHPNLIITPHIAGSTVDAWSMTQSYTIHRIIQVLESRTRQSIK
ncbi:MAG: hydroxyacid dehydrogenase [Deltaproteobacteria bacterium]|nr:hydroxyacid dehydrogenase [Deltaproteobacteria bacterium]